MWHFYLFFFQSVLFTICCSVAQSCLTLCNPVDCSTPGFPVLHYLPEFAQLMSIESVMPSNHLILSRPLLLLLSIFPRIRVFSSELAFCIRWPKYQRFIFSISPSKEYSGLMSFRIVSLYQEIQRRKWQPTPVFLPGESYGQRSLMGYSPWVAKESDMTQQLNTNSNYCIYLVIKGFKHCV